MSEQEPLDLQQKFPSMRPIKSLPGLFTFNGFGLGMYGKRNQDPETGIYIKTRCLCVVFIPILALDAYRVADAPGKGWYFLGKENLSDFARLWRWFVILLVVGLVGTAGWKAHVESPEYRAGKAREKAGSLVSGGRVMEAVNVYRDALRDGCMSRAECAPAVVPLLRGEITSGNAMRAASAIHYVDDQAGWLLSGELLIPDLASLALEAAGKCGNPADAAGILSAFRPAPTEIERVHKALRTALESEHKADPENRDVAIKLALIREEFGEVEGALGLLAPAADKLGSGEGARLYGRLLLGEGRFSEALVNLERYVTPRIEGFHRKEKAVESAYEGARNRGLGNLNRTGGPPGFRTAYEAAGEAEQVRMVEEYLSKQVQKDALFLAARDAYQEAVGIVPTIMDLGVARLRIAQAEKDPAKRTGLLKQAEEAFLSVRGVAGETDSFKLYLGQIQFWSGREAEGRKLFDGLLESNKRNFATLYGLASVFRDLGEENDARKLLEEAFPKASNVSEKSAVASLRSLLARNTDEMIEWLKKGDSSNPTVAVKLSEALGQKAEEAGDVENAKLRYREALAGYEKGERTSASLNNSAILYGSLYRLEGRQEDFEKSARLFSEAVDLLPANSILSFNSAESLLSAAVIRLVGERVHRRLLQSNSGLDALRYLYENESEKEELLKRLRADPNYRKALARFWDALLLAPKNTTIYAWGAGLLNYVGDADALERLADKAEEQDFDFTAQKDEFSRYLKKERDARIRESIKSESERTKALLAGLDDPKSKAMAQGQVSAVYIVGFPLGAASAGGKWLEDLQAAQNEVSCSGLRSSLKAAMEVVALEQLGKADPECAEIIEVNRRLLDAPNILRLLVRAGGDLGKRVRAHPAVVAVREETARTEEMFPTSFGLSDWLLVDGLVSDAGPRLRDLVKDNRIDTLTRRIQYKITFEGPGTLLQRFWVEMFEGDVAGARAQIPKMEAFGVKIPQMF